VAASLFIVAATPRLQQSGTCNNGTCGSIFVSAMPRLQQRAKQHLLYLQHFRLSNTEAAAKQHLQSLQHLCNSNAQSIQHIMEDFCRILTDSQSNSRDKK
jgi:hypothetical protein